MAAVVPTKQQKKPPRARRKLQDATTLEESSGGPSTGQHIPKPELGEAKPKPKARAAAKKKSPVEDTLIFGVKEKPARMRKRDADEKHPIACETDSGIAPKEIAKATKSEQVSEDRGTEEVEKLPRKEKKAPRTAETKTRTKKATGTTLVQGGENTNVTGNQIAELEVPARRPRRQAAIEAAQKVNSGYEQELIPADKLRRYPNASTKSRKRVEATVQQDPVVKHEVETVEQTPTTRPVDSLDENIDAKTEVRPAKRGRKAAGNTTRAKVPKPKEEEAHSSKTAATRFADTEAARDLPDEPRVEVSNVVGEANGTEDGKKLKRTRRVLAESDVNIVRHSPLEPESEKSLTNIKSRTRRKEALESDAQMPREAHKTEAASKEQPARTAKPVSEPEHKVAKRSRAVQPVKPVDLTSHDAPESAQPPSARKRHKIEKDEDLDWLFDKPAIARSLPTASQRPALNKRQKRPDTTANDMDLDDLLESIAGFSGKVLTGRRGRAVAG